MKEIILIRHAKSSWKDPKLPDKFRDLNKRGKKDVILIGTVLAGLNIIPDLMFTSPAKRAKKTCKAIAKQINFNLKDISELDVLYHGCVGDIFDRLKMISSTYSSIMLFGHNPTFNYLADELLKDGFLENIVTTGVVQIHFDINRWSGLTTDIGELKLYTFPRRHYV